MYFNKMNKIFVALFIISSMIYSQDVTLSFGSVDETTGTMEVVMTNSVDVAGFQFDVTGATLTGASGGSAQSAGFMVSTNETTVIGFSLTGAVISPGSEVLTVLTFSDYSGLACIENGILAGAGGGGLDVGYGDCYGDVPCDDEDADGICDDEDDCVGEYDECGVCNGDGSSCEETTVTLSFGSMDISSGTVEIMMENSVDVAGFQFELDGLTITGASGGSAQDAGFMVSTSEITVIGFSLSGAVIPSGSGVLTILTFSDMGELACIENAVISGEAGVGLDVGYGDCYEGEPDPAEVDISFSSFSDGTLEVHMTNSVDVAGFQFDIVSSDLTNLEIVEISGGSSSDYLDMVQYSNPDDLNGGRVLGFSLSGAVIPPGSGVLLNIDVSFEDETGTIDFSGVQFSDSEASPLEVSVGGGISVEGGGCDDEDADGICDDEDDCVGEYDECDVCNGLGPDYECWDGSLVCDTDDCPEQPDVHYSVDLEPTGEFQLVIFQDSITSLEAGDEVGVFDAMGVVESCNPDDGCNDPEYGEVLVGAGVWTGSQLEISAVMSVDLSDFNGPVLNGAVEDNPVVIKVWKAIEEMEYSATATWSAGSGDFGDLILAASDLSLDPLAIEDYSIPTEYNLIPVYPNPFNPTTTIGYSMPMTSQVRISIFDMLGREVTILSDEVKQAGNHTFIWNATDFPSGFYFISMRSNDFHSTQKVTLIK